MTSNLTENDRDALMALATAENGGRAPVGACLVATNLMYSGHRAHVAVRVAMTPQMTIGGGVTESDLWSRPGREIAESIERHTPRVAKALIAATLAVRCPREAVQP